MSDLRTPEDFVNYYSNLLKDELGQYDIQVNKLGFIGYMLNLLGWTNYDIKTYYDNLFKESFVATAASEENLYLHASIYGFTPDFATAALAKGQFILEIDNLPSRDSNVSKREIILSGGTSSILTSSNDIVQYSLPITIDVNGKIFSSNSTYRFTEETSGQFSYYTRVTSESKAVEIVPSINSTIKVPFYDFYQYEESVYVIDIPYYPFNSYYSHKITLNDGENLAGLEVYILINSTWKQFNIQNVKIFNDGDSDNVFLRKLSTTEFVIDFGSGVHGLWVPNTSAKIILKYTTGTDGNLFGNLTSGISSPSQIEVVSYDSLGKVLSTTVYDSNLITSEFYNSDGGTNPLQGEDLRNSIIKYIQTRDNMITELDFYNIAEKYYKDISFLFKKYDVVKNTFYCCKAFRDRYKSIVGTTNMSVKKISLTKPTGVSITSLYSSSYTLTNGTYTYKVAASNGLYLTPVETKSITIDGSTKNGVRLTWTAVDGAQYYIIYGRSSTSDQYWIVTTNSFTDTGSSGTSGSIPFNIGVKNYSFYPLFFINNERYVSPHLYKYNSEFDWYEGYVFKDFMYVKFSNCIEQTQTGYTSAIRFDVVPLYVNISFSKETNETTIYIKSYQTFIDNTGPSGAWNFKAYLSIPELNISTILMTNVVDNPGQSTEMRYFKYVYSGPIMVDEFMIKCDLYRYETQIKTLNSTTRTGWYIKAQYLTDTIVGCAKISDQLVIPKFTNSYSNVDYYINIPVVNEEQFLSDKEFFIDSFSEFNYSLNFQERRMISDEVQLRFLNTIGVSNDYLSIILKQNYNIPAGIKLPLRLDVAITYDNDYVISNKINMIDEKDSIVLELADRLQSKFTGTNICFYNSMIIDLIHNRSYVKRVVVTLKDSNGVTLENGIEMLSTEDVASKFVQSSDDITLQHALKFLMVNYIPPYWYWDLDYLNTDETYQDGTGKGVFLQG